LLCLGCGNEIPEGENCPICASHHAVHGRARSPVDEPEERPTYFCTTCGNEVFEGESCAVCETRAARAAALAARAQEPSQNETDDEDYATTFCPSCGNEVPAGQACAICQSGHAVKRPRRPVDPELARTQLCPSCGNEVPADQPCGICQSGHAIKRRVRTRRICRGCGNEVDDPARCPICASGRALKPQREPEGPVCPQCDELLETQDWDGISVMMCPSCQGSFFPHGGLEQTLDKLRDNTEPASLREVMQELRSRTGATLPKAVRYKKCPVCRLSMTRRVYAGVSGVIIDMCGHHGRWVDQASFTAITDFVSRGGDLLARRNPLERKR